VAEQLLGLETTLDGTLVAILAWSAVVQEKTSFLTHKGVALPIAAL
jgi:hypothetical protein